MAQLNATSDSPVDIQQVDRALDMLAHSGRILTRASTQHQELHRQSLNNNNKQPIDGVEIDDDDDEEYYHHRRTSRSTKPQLTVRCQDSTTSDSDCFVDSSYVSSSCASSVESPTRPQRLNARASSRDYHQQEQQSHHRIIVLAPNQQTAEVEADGDHDRDKFIHMQSATPSTSKSTTLDSGNYSSEAASTPKPSLQLFGPTTTASATTSTLTSTSTKTATTSATKSTERSSSLGRRTFLSLNRSLSFRLLPKSSAAQNSSNSGHHGHQTPADEVNDCANDRSPLKRSRSFKSTLVRSMTLGRISCDRSTNDIDRKPQSFATIDYLAPMSSPSAPSSPVSPVYSTATCSRPTADSDTFDVSQNTWRKTPTLDRHSPLRGTWSARSRTLMSLMSFRRGVKTAASTSSYRARVMSECARQQRQQQQQQQQQQVLQTTGTRFQKVRRFIRLFTRNRSTSGVQAARARLHCASATASLATVTDRRYGPYIGPPSCSSSSTSPHPTQAASTLNTTTNCHYYYHHHCPPLDPRRSSWYDNQLPAARRANISTSRPTPNRGVAYIDDDVISNYRMPRPSSSAAGSSGESLFDATATNSKSELPTRTRMLKPDDLKLPPEEPVESTIGLSQVDQRKNGKSPRHKTTVNINVSPKDNNNNNNSKNDDTSMSKSIETIRHVNETNLDRKSSSASSLLSSASDERALDRAYAQCASSSSQRERDFLDSINILRHTSRQACTTPVGCRRPSLTANNRLSSSRRARSFRTVLPSVSFGQNHSATIDDDDERLGRLNRSFRLRKESTYEKRPELWLTDRSSQRQQQPQQSTSVNPGSIDLQQSNSRSSNCMPTRANKQINHNVETTASHDTSLIPRLVGSTRPLIAPKKPERPSQRLMEQYSSVDDTCSTTEPKVPHTNPINSEYAQSVDIDGDDSDSECPGCRHEHLERQHRDIHVEDQQQYQHGHENDQQHETNETNSVDHYQQQQLPVCDCINETSELTTPRDCGPCLAIAKPVAGYLTSCCGSNSTNNHHVSMCPYSTTASATPMLMYAAPMANVGFNTSHWMHWADPTKNGCSFVPMQMPAIHMPMPMPIAMPAYGLPACPNHGCQSSMNDGCVDVQQQQQQQHQQLQHQSITNNSGAFHRAIDAPNGANTRIDLKIEIKPDLRPFIHDSLHGQTMSSCQNLSISTSTTDMLQHSNQAITTSNNESVIEEQDNNNLSMTAIMATSNSEQQFCSRSDGLAAMSKSRESLSVSIQTLTRHPSLMLQ